ncbi:NAD(P)H-dependent glycerol-3-phosphate dehydrogenase [Polaromonas sp. CG_23.6]|uniref:NAD(P)H-dependent glycerol-3-phosphate dehydrogenase n=1 Tax=Polaromonas sp. CG_23.6 TaxID=2760709 RepID=UPI002476C590|nr:NAD(P)H-dependent glycerol-3-phosphate dehydrogenase [Polaromonas sp. CG_23.6]MDH6183933.1 glycerol-3-phosphate dehydrogenase (NAD(P)+) [Polaromonas sp. CG_23.6]
MKIVVLGAGAWGTALAVNAAGAADAGVLRHEVTLWARNPVQLQALQAERINTHYLPDIALPSSLRLQGGNGMSLAEVVKGQDLIILAGPVAAARSMLLQLRHAQVPVAWLSKGLEAPVLTESAASASASASAPASPSTPFGLMVHEVRAQVAPDLRAGVLSGPSFALEVAREQPTALVAASEHAEVRDALVAAFHSPSLRVYASDDLIGVEVGGAVKNVMAIAAGLCDGLQLGFNARAALITRGLAEMMRLGVALGARPETFTGLSGLGDLVLTATGDLSRNRKVGLLLAQGKSLGEVLTSLGHVAEGVYCARTVVQRAASLGVEMPIAQSVVDLLDGRLQAAEAVALLMEREPTTELDLLLD